MANRITNVTALQAAIDTLTAQGFNPEVVEKLGNIRNSYARKAASTGERKPTKTQVANEGIKENILSLMESDRLYSATEIAKALDGEPAVQKVSALLRQLVAAGAVIRTEDKRKAFYQIAQ